MSTYQKVLLTDVDGCLLHWTRAFEDHIRNVIGLEVKDSLDDHYYVEHWLDIHPDEAGKIINDFHASSALECLPPMPGAVEGMRTLTEAGYRFVAITASGAADETYRMRKKNLLDSFGDVFDAIHTVGVFESKEMWLKKYDPTWWIEDTYRHAVSATQFGHRAFLFTRGHNSTQGDHPGVTRVTEWPQIVQAVLADETVP